MYLRPKFTMLYRVIISSARFVKIHRCPYAEVNEHLMKLAIIDERKNKGLDFHRFITKKKTQSYACVNFIAQREKKIGGILVCEKFLLLSSPLFGLFTEKSYRVFI